MRRALALLALVACRTTLEPPDAGAVDPRRPGRDAGAAEPAAARGVPVAIDVSPGPVDPGPRELPITVQRGFTCETESVGAGDSIADVEGAVKEDLFITPASSDCTFHLFYRVGSDRWPLSAQAGGYLLAVARKSASGVRAACASDIAHHARGADRETDTVAIRCWAAASPPFRASVVAVPPEATWAAWVRKLEPHPTRADAFVLEWARDFSFNFFNMSDQGRPGTDGMYQTVLVFDGTTLTAEPPMGLTSVTNPFAGSPPEPWSPGPADLAFFDAVRAKLDAGR